MGDTQHNADAEAPQDADTVLAIPGARPTSYHTRADCSALKSKTTPEEMSRHRAVDILDRDPCPRCTEEAEVARSDPAPPPRERWPQLFEAEDTEREAAGQ